MEDFGTVLQREYGFKRPSKITTRTGFDASSRTTKDVGSFRYSESFARTNRYDVLQNSRSKPSNWNAHSNNAAAVAAAADVSSQHSIYDEVFGPHSQGFSSTIPYLDEIIKVPPTVPSRLKVTEFRDHEIFKGMQFRNSKKDFYEDVFGESPVDPSPSSPFAFEDMAGVSGSSRASSGSPYGTPKKESPEASRLSQKILMRKIDPEMKTTKMMGNVSAISEVLKEENLSKTSQRNAFSSSPSPREQASSISEAVPAHRGTARLMQEANLSFTSRSSVSLTSQDVSRRFLENDAVPAGNSWMTVDEVDLHTSLTARPPPARVPPSLKSPRKSNLSDEDNLVETKAQTGRSTYVDRSVAEKVLDWELRNAKQQEEDAQEEAQQREILNAEMDTQSKQREILNAEMATQSKQESTKRAETISRTRAGREVIEKLAAEVEERVAQQAKLRAERALMEERDREARALLMKKEHIEKLEPTNSVKETAEATPLSSSRKEEVSAHMTEDAKGEPENAKDATVSATVADDKATEDCDKMDADSQQVTVLEQKISKSNGSSESSDSVRFEEFSEMEEDEEEEKQGQEEKTTTDTAPETPERKESVQGLRISQESQTKAASYEKLDGQALENAWEASAMQEMRDKAASEARVRAERSLVARITAEVRERASVEAKARAEKAVAGKEQQQPQNMRPEEAASSAPEQLNSEIKIEEITEADEVKFRKINSSRISLRDQLKMERPARLMNAEAAGAPKKQKDSAEARLQAERTLVERITAEVRERAAMARAEKFEKERDALREKEAQKEKEARELQEREEAAASAKERERLEKEREREREIEREKDRIGMERDARVKAEAEAKDKAETEAKMKAERTAQEARVKFERAAVERATAEARKRAEQALFERAEKERQQQQQKANGFYENSKMRAASVPKQRYGSSASMQATSHPDAVESNIRRTTSTTNLASAFADDNSSEQEIGFQEVKGETPERRKARLERHQRTLNRAAKALAAKNQRDNECQREQAEKQRLSERLDADIRRWALGKEGNIRALLSTLQYVLGSESGWKQISLTELINPVAVKKAYKRATLCVHPDKMQQKGANVQQKYMAEKVYDILQEGWNRFNSQDTL